MTVVWGCVLAAGMLLVAAPWLWPRRARPVRSDRGGLRRLLDEAGLPGLTATVFGALSFAAALAVGAMTWLITGIGVLALLGSVAAGCGPAAWVRGRRARRSEARRGLWPDVCDLLVASVRAGMGLPDAVASLADTAPPVLRVAFADYRRDLAASGHFDASVSRLKDVLADATADRIVETLRMARHVGGTELPTVLRSLSASVRAEVAVRGEVTARQSWVRGAAVVGVIAPWAILALLITRPEGAAAYATGAGVGLIVAAAAVSVVAYRLMMRIGRLPQPGRWFR
ncbi:type II secretion system F family protein [Microbacterium gorillae]|uniref:type II secretion system F family protein n=1 Tax=Microbacterium gorillae TaxID=1231063 RepID=UPI0005909730|nr:type II secretion system F family protein [Microbacterium gorillae]